MSLAHQVVLLVLHLGGVTPHAVDRQQQVDEGEGRVQPQQIVPAQDDREMSPTRRVPASSIRIAEPAGALTQI